MPTIAAGPVELYYEVRGSGPPVLFVMGATGDAGHFTKVAEVLADEFTVVTYDRRGNSRSPRPPGWNATSMEEQAGDAAALLHALELSPAAVFGTSSGGLIALCLVIRHPEVVRAAILHETGLYPVLERPEDFEALIGPVVREGMAAGGPPVAVERFWRFVSGDANWEALDPGLRERMRNNGEILFDVERPAYASFRPDATTLAAVEAPVQVLASEQSPQAFAEIAGWLAERLGVEVTYTPGTHTPYLDHPHELARTIRPFLRRVSPAR